MRAEALPDKAYVTTITNMATIMDKSLHHKL